MVKMWNRFVMCLTLAASVAGLSVGAAAQDPGTTNVSGNTDVYSSATSQTHSGAYVDASVFYYYDINILGQQPDICSIINQVLKGTALTGVSYPGSGAVIDTRGIINLPNNGTVSPLFCHSNPFAGVTNAKATVLLPSAVIVINFPWILPSNARIVGQGRNTTTIAPASSSEGGFQPDLTNALIEMGAGGSTACGTSNICTGVAIEHLTISGADTSGANTYYHAIYNNNAQDASYVNDVVFLNVGQTSNTPIAGPALTTGLFIGPSATYSGPYSNLGFNGSAQCGPNNCTDGHGHFVSCTCQATACVQIQAQTRGLHGITCTAGSTQNTSTNPPPKAAIYLDSYNNTIDNVHIEGFYDAIVVGDNPASSANGPGPYVTGNTISNITSAFGSNSGPVWNTVHICNPSSATQDPNTACQNVAGTVGDVHIIQAQSTGPSVPAPPGAFTAGTILDDLTLTTVNSSASPTFVGMYSLGEHVAANGGYTRFTTSPGPNLNSNNMGGIPNWGVGNTAFATTQPFTSCSNPGAIYSNTAGSSGKTLFVCSAGVWKPIG